MAILTFGVCTIFHANWYELRNHVLHGEYAGLRSINVTGDWRALFKELDNGEIYFFVLLGTHSELYKK